MPQLDPRIAAGTTTLLDRRRRELDGGATHLGWKAGFGAPGALEKLGTDRPLVGYLTAERRLAPGAEVSLTGWTTPVLEAEVAVHLARDLGAGATRDEAVAAIGGLAATIELADLDVPPTEVEQILRGNIYHRHVLLAETVPYRDTSALHASVSRDGDEVASTDTPDALTGELGSVLASMADTLAATGGAMVAGDVVITGSVVPPVPLVPGDWLVALAGLGELTVRVRP